MPKLNGLDPAVLRRVIKVDFPAYFTKEGVQVPAGVPQSIQKPAVVGLIKKLQEKEHMEALLKLALEEAHSIEQGFSIEDFPKQVQNATNLFKKETNSPKMFLEECCTVDEDLKNPKAKSQSSLLYSEYKQYMETNGLGSPVSVQQFSKEMVFVVGEENKRKVGGCFHYFGIDLLTTAPAAFT